MIIRSQKLTAKKFSPFGDVVTLYMKPIDFKKSQRWSYNFPQNLFEGKPVINLLYSPPRSMVIDSLERHMNSSQTFLPINSNPFIIIVAKTPQNKPTLFISDGKQGVILKSGVWHCSPLPVKKPIFFVLIHRNPDVDLQSEVVKLKQKVTVI